MKQRNSLYFVAFIMLFVLVMPQNMTAKKIMYKHHQYKGDVSKEQIPQGKGEIDIAGIVIKGIFDATNITNASFEKEWLRYEGNVTYNESQRITLKAGGKFTKYYYVRPNLNDKKSTEEILLEDTEIDNNDLNNNVAKIQIEIKMQDVPTELNPPIVKYEVPIHLSKLRDNNGTDIFRFIAPSELMSGEVTFEDYKDEQERIWNYTSKRILGYSNRFFHTYKVTYPDGSYSSNETGGKIVKP